MLYAGKGRFLEVRKTDQIPAQSVDANQPHPHITYGQTIAANLSTSGQIVFVSVVGLPCGHY